MTVTIMAATTIARADPVFDELSAKSALPKTELQSLLANCNSSQQSMYFCAWRDQLSAEKKLRHEQERIAKAQPARQSALDSEVNTWLRQRDSSCEKAARQEFGEGSMAPTARVLCSTKQTKRMLAKLKKQ